MKKIKKIKKMKGMKWKMKGNEMKKIKGMKSKNEENEEKMKKIKWKIKKKATLSKWSARVTKRGGHVCDENDDSSCRKELSWLGIQPNGKVWNGHENEREDDVNRQVGEGLAKEIHVGSVHAVKVLPQEDWQLARDHLWQRNVINANAS